MSPRSSRRESPERRAIRHLLTARGIGRHALFLTQREGTQLPGDLEAVSGFVLTADGAVYSFWLAWDERRDTLALDPFHLIPRPEEVFAEDAEYQAARRVLGLR
jgi:hypothetical protein